MPITVLLADDEEVVRRAITRFLVPHPSEPGIAAGSYFFANDIEAEALAASFGAAKLLDKTKLFDELIPTIMQLASPSASARRTAD